VTGPPRRAAWESAFCYRAIGGLGIEFEVDWGEPAVYALIWRPTEPTCPDTYKNENGVEVKMTAVAALQKLRISTNAFIAAYRKLSGRKENIAAMVDLSIGLLNEHLDTLKSNIAILFP
jgi:hypothetical protein